MGLQEDLSKSRKCEMELYLSQMKTMYNNAILQNSDVYDIAAKYTNDFTSITSKAILSDSRIIKTLRYSIAPSISQMKFGQFFGLNSIDKFENDKVNKGTRKYLALSRISNKIAEFCNNNLDKSRFIWLYGSYSESEIVLSKKYAKSWTCSIAADQNAQTKFRNWRKNLQEHSIATKLIELGYTKSSFTGVVSESTDINIGEYTQELRVKGRTRQKADVIVRSKRNNKLVLIEAKAVGVEIDSTKRIKECCDKANDWASSNDLDNPVTVAVIAGFFNENGINNLKASNVEVIWEHRLSDLEDIL